MGTATYEVCELSHPDANFRGALVASGETTTSVSATNLTDGAAGAGSEITVKAGQVLIIQVSENARIRFGGTAATATAGHIVFASETAFIEVSYPGTISVIDVA